MAQFSVNPQRFDPYKNFKFRVKLDGRYVAGVHEVTGIEATSAAVRPREGVNPPFKSPTRMEYEPITLERGITHDGDFENWAKKVSEFPSEPGVSNACRRDIGIEVFDEEGQLARTYTIFRCWVSEYHVITERCPDADAATIKRITLENEGWECEAVADPVEPTSTEAA